MRGRVCAAKYCVRGRLLKWAQMDTANHFIGSIIYWGKEGCELVFVLRLATICLGKDLRSAGLLTASASDKLLLGGRERHPGAQLHRSGTDIDHRRGGGPRLCAQTRAYEHCCGSAEGAWGRQTVSCPTVGGLYNPRHARAHGCRCACLACDTDGPLVRCVAGRACLLHSDHVVPWQVSHTTGF